METLKWLASAGVSIIVVCVGIVFTLSVLAFTTAVQIVSLLLAAIVGLTLIIKNTVLSPRDKSDQ